MGKYGIAGLKDTVSAMENLSDKSKLRTEFVKWIEAVGMDFLAEVQDQIIRVKAVDTRRLVNSFARRDKGGIWKLSKEKLSLEVGTNVHYARYVNDGHRTRVAKGTQNVPRWVEGRHYFDKALKITEKTVERSMGNKLDHFVESVWGGG